MTVEELAEVFERHEEEFLKFNRIEQPRSRRPDLHAFLLLDALVPGATDMVSAAEHDEIWLDVDTEALAAVVTEEQVRDLVRCGVRWDAEFDCLALFV
jgi:hypothetical protein